MKSSCAICPSGLAVLAFSLCLAGIAPACAAPSDPAQLSGNAAVLPSGVLMVEGHEVELWGIESLASDQQCWHDDHAWDCGEESMIALRHHIAGHPLRCTVKLKHDHGKSVSQCFVRSNGKEDDLANYLVAQGWARDRADESGGIYAPAEDKARHHRRGIWTSRFQSAQDWKNGVPNYIEYQQTRSRRDRATDPR